MTNPATKMAATELASIANNHVAQYGFIGAIDAAVDYFAYRVAKQMIAFENKTKKENND